MTPTILPAAPKFAIGEEVLYRDHHGRVQGGRVFAIVARWDRWHGGTGIASPSVLYTVEHPTYRNNRIYLNEAALASRTSKKG